MKVHLVCLAVIAVCCQSCRQGACPVEQPMADAAYVWQCAWAPAVAQGILRATDAMQSFMVLAADVDARTPSFEHRVIPVAWEELAKTGRQVWAVVRVNHALSVHIKHSCDSSADVLAGLFRNLLADARKGGLALHGLQIDYDCPTEDLIEYAALIKALRARMPDAAWSITALPTWLDQPAVRALVAGLDHFVLQVHSLDMPRDNDGRWTLCDTARIAGWVKRTSTLNVPYYIALPTYGYRLFFNAKGEFTSVAAEATSGSPEGYTTRDVSADPVSIAEVVRTLHASPPNHCRGIVWFRLPVDTDQLNWPWPALQKVMAGQTPKWSVAAEVRTVKKDLYEVWIRNEGEFLPPKPVRIPVRWNGMQLVASDCVNGFHANPSPDLTSEELVGTAPGPGNSAMAAWFRMASGDLNKNTEFETGDVESVQ